MRFSILVLFLIKESEQGVSFYQGSPDEKAVLSCVNRIVKRHFDSEHEVTILTQGSKDYVKGMESTVRLIGNVSKPDKISWFPHTRQAVVFLNGYFHRDLTILMSLGTFHRLSRFLIVCTIVDSSLSTKNYLIQLIQYLHQNQRWVVVIAIKSIAGDIRLYGYTKTAYGNCDSPEILSFGNCRSENSLSGLFPNFINYNLCPLRLATYDWPPFTRFVTENGKKESIGIESSLASLIVEHLNGSTSFLDAAPSQIRTIIGNHDADIGYGQMALYQNNGYLYTKSYSSVQGLVLLPKLSSVVNPALSNLMPLESTVWIVLILVVIFIIILRSFLPIFKAISLLNTMALFLALGIKTRPTGPVLRTYFMSLVLFGYIITQAYLANLTMIFTKSFDYNEIESLDKLDKSTMSIGGAGFAVQFFEEKYPRLLRDYKVMNLSWFKKNLADLRSGKGGLATYVEVSKYVNYNHWKHTTTIPEIITSYPIAMVVPNVSIILPTCNRIITAVLEAGIMERWVYTLNHQQWETLALAEHADEDNVYMNLKQFVSIFRLLGIGLGLSTTVFIIELLIAAFREKKNQRQI